MPRKGENIYKRKDGRWEARYIKQRTAEGKALYGYLYAHSYRDAKCKLHEQLRVSAETRQTYSCCMEAKNAEVFEVAAHEWYKAVIPTLKESTVNKYGNLLDSYIIPTFGTIRLDQLSQEAIESGCQKLLLAGGRKAKGLSPKTVTDILSVMRNIISFSVKTGKYVPCDARSIHIRQTTKNMRVLSLTEQERLCQYLYSDLNAGNVGILVCLFTGIRIGELCALRWEDVSLPDQTIYICRTLQRVQDHSSATKKTKVIITAPKSVCSIRTIPIPKELAQILASYQTSVTGFILTNSCQHYILH